METSILNLKVKDSAIIIVDPYAHLEPQDQERFPAHEKECHDFAINDLKPLIKFFPMAAVATWGPREIYEDFKSLPRLFELKDLSRWTSQKNIIYCGYHYGRCILRMPLGVKEAIKVGYTCSVLDDYSMVFPADNYNDVQDLTVQAGAKIIKGKVH